MPDTPTYVVSNPGSGGENWATTALTTGAGGKVMWSIIALPDGAGGADYVDAGNPMPVTGTVAATQSGAWNVTNISGTVSLPTGASTATLQTTGNTALAAIQAAVEGTLTVGTHAVTQSGAWNITNITGTVSLPTGAATEATLATVETNTDFGTVTGGGTETGALRVTLANNSTGVLSIDDNSGSITVDNGGTFAVQASQAGAWNITNVSGTVSLPSGASTAANQSTMITALQLIDDPVATVSATPLMRVAIFDAADSQITSFGGGTQYVEDAPAAANPTGTTPVLVRADSPGAVTDTNGDVIAQRATNFGAAYVQVVDSSGNFIDTFGGSGGTATTDDGAFAAGAGQGTPMMAFATSDAVDSGDVGVVAMDVNRNLKVSIEVDNAGIGGGTQYVEDDAAAANPTGTVPMLVRQDTPAGLTTADGDNVAQRATNFGAAFCQILDSSGNFIDTFGGSGGTATTDDGAFVAGTGQGTPVMGFFSADTVDAGDVGVLAMDASRRLLVSIEADNVGIGGGTQYQDDTDTHSGASVGNLLMAAATPTDGAVDANDIGALAMSLDRRLHVDAQIVGQDANVTIAGTVAISGGTITIDNSSIAVTQSGSWTVTANAGTDLNTSALALESGGNLATIAGDTTSLDTKIFQYVADDFNTGTGTDTVSVFGIALPGASGHVVGGTATNPLVVDLGANNDVTVTGSVTANAGTNLNTSALALESGGNLAAITTAVQLIDNANATIGATDLIRVAIFDNADNQITTFGGSGGTSSTDDGAFTAGTGLGTPLMGFVTADSVDSGDVGVVGMSTDRSLKTFDSLWNYAADDFDTGTGSDTITVVGLALPADGGHVIAGTVTDPLFVDLVTAEIKLVTPNGDSAMDDTLDAIKVSVVGGSGVEYTEGQTDTSITGVAMLWEDTGDTLRPASAATPLPVSVDRLTGNVGVALQTDAIMDDVTALTPKFAVIDAASSGDNTILAAVASKKIRVLAAFLMAAGAVTVRFEGGAGGTALTGQMNIASNGGFTLPFNPVGWFETGVNTLLNLELSGAISVDGCLTYVEV